MFAIHFTVDLTFILYYSIFEFFIGLLSSNMENMKLLRKMLLEENGILVD